MTDDSPVSAAVLTSFIERIERLEEEKASIAADIKDIYKEAKSQGFSTPIIREIVKLRKMNPEDRAEKEELLDLYWSAVE